MCFNARLHKAKTGRKDEAEAAERQSNWHASEQEFIGSAMKR